MELAELALAEMDAASHALSALCSYPSLLMPHPHPQPLPVAVEVTPVGEVATPDDADEQTTTTQLLTMLAASLRKKRGLTEKETVAAEGDYRDLGSLVSPKLLAEFGLMPSSSTDYCLKKQKTFHYE